jgi:hypothetical protein
MEGRKLETQSYIFSFNRITQFNYKTMFHEEFAIILPYIWQCLAPSRSSHTAKSFQCIKHQCSNIHRSFFNGWDGLSLRNGNLPNATLSTIYSIWPNLGSSPGCHNSITATNQWAMAWPLILVSTELANFDKSMALVCKQTISTEWLSTFADRGVLSGQRGGSLWP